MKNCDLIKLPLELVKPPLELVKPPPIIGEIKRKIIGIRRLVDEINAFVDL